MFDPEWVFLRFAVGSESRDEPLPRLVTLRISQDLRRVVVGLHALEPLEKFLVFFCDLVEPVESLLVVQSRHHLVRLVEVGYLRR